MISRITRKVPGREMASKDSACEAAVDQRPLLGGGAEGNWGLGFRVWGLGFRVWGLGFRVSV